MMETYKRPTIKDIAQKLGVNPSTVSRALADHPALRPELKKQIKNLANKLGYKPNYAALNLLKGSSKSIALIIPEISMFFFPSVIQAINDSVSEKGYSLLLFHTQNQPEKEAQYAELCGRLRVDGVIVSLSKTTENIEHFESLSDLGIPIVFFDKIFKNTYSYKVVIDDLKAAHDATSYLIKQTKSKKGQTQHLIGIFGNPALEITQDRMLGFSSAIKEYNIPLHDKDLLYADNNEDAYRQLTNIFKSKKHFPQGIFVMSDEILLALIKVASEQKVKLCTDIQVVAMSDGYYPTLVQPNIPYVETSGYKMGQVTCTLLFDILNRKAIDGKTVVLPSPLIISS